MSGWFQNKETAMKRKREERPSRIGWDSHRKFSKVTARNASGEILWHQRIEHGNRELFRARIRRWPQGTPVILESTFGWGWTSDELQAAGLEPHLANSRKLEAWRRARGLAKSDRLDADLLSELWDEKQRWWEVWLAPPEVRELREWMRYRMSLVAMQTQIKNRIHAVLHRHGILQEYSDLFGVHGRRFLQLLLVSKDAPLPASGRATLQGHLQLLEHVRRQIAGATREIRGQLVRTPEGRRLKTLPGVGEILAYTLVAEIGRIERFASAKRLVAYSLLAPRARDTGQEPHEEDSPIGRRIGHAGRRTLQWAWIEAAHGAVRSGGRFRAIYDRVTNGGKKNRGHGYIAVANALCRLGYVLWKKGVDYTEDRPVRSGARSAKHASRPGKGQPEAAMVAAVI
jgi:transposase